MTMGNIISYHRKRMNITQEALAQKLSVTNQAVSKWESGQACPDIQLLPKLADIFEITIDTLFGRASTTEAVPPHLPWEDDGALHIAVYQGHRLLKQAPEGEELSFSYSGPALNISSAVSVFCGDVEGNVDAGANVECGDVEGNVDAGANVQCGDVEGNVDAGANVQCGDVDGNVDAGAMVNCGDVDGDVKAGFQVSCGNVDGTIFSQK